MAFVHLHCHSNFSLLDGAASVHQLVEAAASFGMPALALTDHDGLYGAIDFYLSAREAGIKPIIGAEVTVVPEKRNVSPKKPGGFPTESGTETGGPLHSGDHLVLMAKDLEGYRALSHLVTEAHLKAGPERKERPGVSLEMLARRADHLICLSAFSQGEVGRALHAGNDAKAEEAAGRYRELFGDRFYLEVTPSREGRDRKVFYKSLRLSEKTGIPLVATNDLHFIAPDDYLIHKALASIGTLTPIAQEFDGKYTRPEYYFRSASEMAKVLREIPHAVERSGEVASRCDLTLPMGVPIFPNYPLPENETPYSYLWKLAFQGLTERMVPLTPRAIERLKYELEIIDKLNLSIYFLILWDIVRFARERGIPLLGRGSAANSLVAYALGITVVDPLKHNLYFERFLNLERKDLPDIDLDLCWVRRDEVLDYVYRRYGQERVAMAATFATFQARAALREVARAFGLSPMEANNLSKKIPFCRAEEMGQVMERFPESRLIPRTEEPYRSIIAIAERIADYPRHLSIHCGGMVIGKEPLPDLVPLTWSRKGIVITQYDMKPLEALGLVKMDLLGHRALTVISDTVARLHEAMGVKIDPWELSDKDKKVAEMVRAGKTLGCFQIESPGMRSLLQMMQAQDTNDLIVALSLIRPGPSASGMKERYVRYRRGLEPVKYLHPKLKEVLGDTYGVMLYQEDILKVAHAIAGFTLAGADSLRQAMTKKAPASGGMARNREAFLVGAMQNRVPNAVAQEIWKLISNFAQYSYCKAHAVTYGLISYQCCYLKAHYPSFFLASVLTNRAGFYAPAAYIGEARRFGVAVKLPDINFSRPEFVADARSIRVGFMQIKGLTENAINSIMTARKDGPLLSLTDFLLRVDITRGEVETLIKCGAFDSFENTRPELLWKLNLSYEKIVREKKRLKEDALLPINGFQEGLMKAEAARLTPHIPDYSYERRLAMEGELLEMFVSAHPLKLLAPELARQGVVSSASLPRHVHERVKVAGLMMASRLAPTVKGEQMKFVTIEDLEGLIEVVLFPRVYQKYGAVTMGAGPFIVTGRVENQNGSLNVVAERIEELEW